MFNSDKYVTDKVVYVISQYSPPFAYYHDTLAKFNFVQNKWDRIEYKERQPSPRLTNQ